MNKIIELKDISKKFNTLSGEVEVFNNINIDIYSNEFLSIIGTSGCGKSTLLNVISKLDNHYDGSVNYLDDITIGYMIKEDALIEYYNVFDNICLGLKINNKYNENTINYVNSLLDKYDLISYKYKHPSELSGGMRQRVALIRTLSLKPDVLLLDEPFSALDYTTRLLINNDVHKIIKDSGITAIMVTHDIEEALSMSDRIIVLDGKPASIKNIYTINNNNIPSKNRNNNKEIYESILDDLCQKNKESLSNPIIETN